MQSASNDFFFFSSFPFCLCFFYVLIPDATVVIDTENLDPHRFLSPDITPRHTLASWFSTTHPERLKKKDRDGDRDKDTETERRRGFWHQWTKILLIANPYNNVTTLEDFSLETLLAKIYSGLIALERMIEVARSSNWDLHVIRSCIKVVHYIFFY